MFGEGGREDVPYPPCFARREWVMKRQRNLSGWLAAVLVLAMAAAPVVGGDDGAAQVIFGVS